MPRPDDHDRLDGGDTAGPPGTDTGAGTRPEDEPSAEGPAEGHADGRPDTGGDEGAAAAGPPRGTGAPLDDAEVLRLEGRLEPADLIPARIAAARVRPSKAAGDCAADPDPLGPARRAADRELVAALRAGGFSGRTFALFEAEYCAYGRAILMMLMRTGEIVGRCARTPPHRPRPLPVTETPAWTEDDMQGLADETAARAMRVFVDRALRRGEWDPDGEASLKTYFVGCCVLQFPNVFARWYGMRRKWEDNERLDRSASLDAAAENVPAPGPPDATSELALDAVVRERWLRTLRPRERLIMELMLHEHTQVQIAEFLGMPVTTVRGVVERVRRRAREQDADQWRA
ncbi:sigma-70 family RNA polymerase sigma factor [Actinomadura rubrisoli]|uniref:Sigma-70 family RNA polymerase sigma factor n=1 Tax=Actinomadura rubrisoli TaxID=2530368 RepID=A0A4V2YST6_9ACTN|nr:sigma-70 family RNA polymerase sigma factor [Actinomadura rubrisoli]TDD71167.1 sigma-70 family RNA polymerase sigma factor [Actinomadura rubrisoli]